MPREAEYLPELIEIAESEANKPTHRRETWEFPFKGKWSAAGTKKRIRDQMNARREWTSTDWKMIARMVDGPGEIRSVLEVTYLGTGMERGG